MLSDDEKKILEKRFEEMEFVESLQKKKKAEEEKNERLNLLSEKQAREEFNKRDY